MVLNMWDLLYSTILTTQTREEPGSCCSCGHLSLVVKLQKCVLFCSLCIYECTFMFLCVCPFTLHRWSVSHKSAKYIFTSTHIIHTYTVYYLQPSLKRAQGGFVGLWKGPRKMFSDKLFTIPQSLLGRVLHRAV